MYFLTSKDPDYAVKGSRDPLGFQVIWQRAARKLIPHLSTVSASIKDFQILSLAFALQRKFNIPNDQFERFFILFEQMMAYARIQKYPNEGFNGIDRVNKNISRTRKTVEISLKSQYQLLSNQRAYGIWGKYYRPFTDMKMSEKADFFTVYGKKIEATEGFGRQARALSMMSSDGAAHINLDKLYQWADLLRKPTGREKALLIESLLNDNCNNELLSLINNNPDFRQLSFYELLEALYDTSQRDDFRYYVRHILHTERVLCPLNRIFRYLQTRSYWKRSDLESDKFLKTCRFSADHKFLDEHTRPLAELLEQNSYDLVVGLVERNESITKKRNTASWMHLSDKSLDVNHYEGAFFHQDFDPSRHNDFNYFLTSYLSLHTQLN